MIKRLSLRSAPLCLVALCLLAPAGRADTAFTVTGTLANSSSVSGTITINTATGVVDGFDVTVTGGFNFTANQFATQMALTGSFTGDYEIAGQTDFTPSASFVAIVLPVTTLVGFTGANICDLANPCNGNFVSDAGPVTNPPPNSAFVGAGSLSSAPEPSTILLMMGGGAMLLAAKRRANRNRKTVLPVL